MPSEFSTPTVDPSDMVAALLAEDVTEGPVTDTASASAPESTDTQSPAPTRAVAYEPTSRSTDTDADAAKASTADPDAEAVPFSELPGLDPRTAASLAKAGLTHAFPIQRAVVPAGIRGRDLLVKSPTGSGKTLAFGLPVIEQIKTGTTFPSALILVPTRELAVQVCDDLTPIARGKNLQVCAVFGGSPIQTQARKAKTAAIVVATPGRLDDLIRNRLIDIRRVRILVLDEADRMLDMGFQPQVDQIVDVLQGERQTLLFSATLDGKVGKIAASYTTDPETVTNDVIPGDGGEIEHVMMTTTNSSKVDTVLDVLQDERDLAVVFVRTKRGADRLKDRLREYGHRSTTIHGGMSQGQRLREYRRFQKGFCDVLVATDVFARGMDLDRISHVINYDLPEDADTYRHRTGRTGRAGRTGIAITMFIPSQRKTLRRMAREANIPLEVFDTPRRPSGTHWKQVPEAERFTDKPSRDEVAAMRREGAPRDGSDRPRRGGGRPERGGSGRPERGGKRPHRGSPERSFNNDRGSFNDRNSSERGSSQRPSPERGGKPGSKPVQGTTVAERAMQHRGEGKPSQPGNRKERRAHLQDKPQFKPGAGPRPARSAAPRGGAGSTVSGVVLSFDANKGFGFIAPDAGGGDVFFHHKRIVGSTGGESIRKGQRVNYGIEIHERGPRAASVELARGRG